MNSKNEEIHWYCPDCENEGVISNWKGTKWGNRVKQITTKLTIVKKTASPKPNES